MSHFWKNLSYQFEAQVKTFSKFFSGNVKETWDRKRAGWWTELNQCRWSSLKVINKNHSSISTVKRYTKEKELHSSIELADKPKILNVIKKVRQKKACQENNIPLKLIKAN